MFYAVKDIKESFFFTQTKLKEEIESPNTDMFWLIFCKY